MCVSCVEVDVYIACSASGSGGQLLLPELELLCCRFS